MRASSQAFRAARDRPISVYVKSILDEHGLPPESILIGHEDFYLVEFTAGFVRSLSLGIVPFDDINDVGHAELRGSMTDSRKDKLAKAATWFGPEPPAPSND